MLARCLSLFILLLALSPSASASGLVFQPEMTISTPLSRDDAPRTHTFVPTSYTTVNGSFAQDDPSAKPSSFDVYAPGAHLGLLGGDWAAFRRYVTALNQEAPANVAYKVIFAGRHGQGHHNVANAKYGNEQWDCYWSMQNGDETSTWGPDALLTEKGIVQAERAHAAWQRELANGAPLPQSWLASPLSRAASTLNITWSGLRDRTPVFHEIWRETIGLHTCDKRRNRAYLEKTYPDFEFEESFVDEDELWTADLQETPAQQTVRARKALDVLFASNADTFVSITTHSGTISALLAAIGHRPWETRECDMVPMLIKAVRETPTKTPDAGPSVTAPPCPSTSNGGVL